MSEILEKFKVGRKVRIIGNQGFEIGVTGVINYCPKTPNYFSDYEDNCFAKVQTLKGEKISVWVIFDEPQYDADGDGPYSEAGIITDYLEII